jgi:S-adenosylmethionine-diacylgycerolhomoserine-N-methlytransferase
MLTALAGRTSRWRRDAATLWAILRPHRRGLSHAATLEAFYRQQAPLYDDFRERLLPGRAELVAALPLTPGAVWVDLGGGTARNLLHAGPRLRTLAQAVVVDLTPSLLEVAHVRRRKEGWSNVSLVRADATQVPLPDRSADVVTFSYALTMMPQWEGALAEAQRILRPGGTLGVVDFYISEGRWPQRTRHGRWTRWFWPWWFGHRDVRLNPSHVPTLGAQFAVTSLTEGHAPVPYLPIGRVPVYRFVGRATDDHRG